MPLYDYQCTSCEHKFSELRRGSEKDESISCPDCGINVTKRLVTGFSVSTKSSAAGCASAPACPSAGFG